MHINRAPMTRKLPPTLRRSKGWFGVILSKGGKVHRNDRCWEKSLNSIAALGLANGFANGRGRGKDDGCGPVGHLDRAFGPPRERFLDVVNQSVIFFGLCAIRRQPRWVESGRRVFAVPAANLHLWRTGGIARGDWCGPPPISTIARIYKAKHRIVAASE
jgi:hypothetical protein